MWNSKKSKRKPKTLYISDLDGTLLAPDGRLSQNTVTLLNHAISRGALISVATARTPATVGTLLRDVRFSLPLVVMTGAALWDKNTGSYSEVRHFRPDQVRAIVEAYRRPEGGGGFLYTLRDAPESTVADKVMQIYHIGELNDVERGFMTERIDSPFKRFDVPASGVSDIPGEVADGVLFFGMRPNEVADGILEGLHSIPGINPMAYHDWYGDSITEIEAFPEGATKAEAVRRLKRLAGADRVVVFGDNRNDLSMMRAADWSVAVANALPEVKAAADEVTGSNAADAVPRYILEELAREE